MICKVCYKEFKRLYSHIPKAHNFSIKHYYDLYLKQPGNSICKCGCNQETKWSNRYFKYKEYVSRNHFLKKYHQDNPNYTKKLGEINTKRMFQFHKDNPNWSSTKMKETHQLYPTMAKDIAVKRIRNNDPKFAKVNSYITREEKSLIAVNQLKDPKSNFGYRKYRSFCYKNIRMRSSWEVLFSSLCDELNVKWEYEPKWFKLLDGSRVLIDFYLPEIDTWIAIKPKKFQDQKLLQIGKELQINYKVLDKTDFNNFLTQVTCGTLV